MIISIVTPVLNGIEYFKECIESVKAATPPSVEVEHLIADGGSTDGSLEIAESYGLRIIKRPDLGLTARMNLGYRSSRGGLIGFLGADDLLLPGAIGAVVAAYERSGRRWIVGRHRWIDPNGGNLGDFRAPPTWMSAKTLVYIPSNTISMVSTYMHRSLFLELGGFNEHLVLAADFSLFARALNKEPFERLSETIACLRRHGQNFGVKQRHLILPEAEVVRREINARLGSEKDIMRYALKAWFNLSNPAWCSGKLLQRARMRLGLASLSYYE